MIVVEKETIDLRFIIQIKLLWWGENRQIKM